MSNNTEQENNPIPESDQKDSPTKTPLEQVKENQAMQQQNLEVAQQRNEPSGEVPGSSIPSDRRHHPQRQNNYEGGENDPNYARLK